MTHQTKLATACAALFAASLGSAHSEPQFTETQFTETQFAELQFTEAQFRLDRQFLAPQGHGVLELSNGLDRGGVVVLEVDRARRVEFRDDGLVFDERAFDGHFTASVPADMTHERMLFQRNLAGLQSSGPIPVFEGRELVDRVPARSFIRKTKPGRMQVFTAGGGGSAVVVDADKSLFITAPVVLDDAEHSFNPCDYTGNPDGAWAFAHVWSELAGTNDPSTMAADWVDTWSVDQTVNGQTASPRPVIRQRLFDAWDSDQAGNSDGLLAIEDAPFHPVAITLRIDLRKTNGYSTASAGEARIVYSFVGDDCSSSQGGSVLVIFEYAINKQGCEVKEWGERWASLSAMELGSPAYQAALTELTREFTDLSTSPNANRLSQVRTNEIELQSTGWEMREFILDPSGSLEPTTVKLTPMSSINGTADVADVVNSMVLNPFTMQYSAPDPQLFEPMIGPSSHIPIPPQTFFWSDTHDAGTTLISDNDARHQFSLNTCSGCHRGETETFFTHVARSVPGLAAGLSGFVTGTTIPDPMDGTMREFNEKERRRVDLQNLIDNSCFGMFLHQPILSAH